jgi:hypothetical protein
MHKVLHLQTHHTVMSWVPADPGKAAASGGGAATGPGSAVTGGILKVGWQLLCWNMQGHIRQSVHLRSSVLRRDRHLCTVTNIRDPAFQPCHDGACSAFSLAQVALAWAGSYLLVSIHRQVLVTAVATQQCQMCAQHLAEDTVEGMQAGGDAHISQTAMHQPSQLQNGHQTQAGVM